MITYHVFVSFYKTEQFPFDINQYIICIQYIISNTRGIMRTSTYNSTVKLTKKARNKNFMDIIKRRVSTYTPLTYNDIKFYFLQG